MAKEITQIILTKEDIKAMVVEKYNLNPDNATVRVSHYAGDVREPAYTQIIVEGQKII